MTGKTTVLGAVLCALIATACGSGGTATTDEPTGSAASATSATEVTADPTATATPSEDAAASEDGPATGELDGPGPTDSKTDLAVPSEDEASAPTEAATPDAGSGGGADAAIEDRSAVALPLNPPEGGFDAGTIIVDEDFRSTTPRIPAFETELGSGGYGNFGDSRFYEIVLEDPEARFAAPVTDLDATASQQVYVQNVSFASSFEGLARIDRGVYCWAANGNDPLSGSRYEMLFTQEGRIQVMRFGADGSPEALVIDEPYDFAPDARPINDGLDPIATFDESARIGLLCRPDAEGRAQVAARVERQYYVTTDSGGPTPGGGAGIVAYGGGTGASTSTIATYSSLIILDGAQVPLR